MAASRRPLAVSGRGQAGAAPTDCVGVEPTDARRRHERLRVELPAVVWLHGRQLAARVVDVSLSGLALLLPEPAPTRQLVRVEVRPDSGAPFPFTAMVVYTVDTGDPLWPCRVGVMLYGIGRERAALWDEFIRKTRAALKARRTAA
ncbi:MAG: PilZ domain-containing protein [Deltaproteobacteria bacterium]|nr:MAG: PilZ domain-containing protein [Deltaproteobacteria bacterium]